MRSLSTKIPYLAGLLASCVAEVVQVSEFTFQGQPARGLGISYVLDGLAVSILSSPVWDCSQVSLQMSQLDEVCELNEEEVTVYHAASPNHLDAHQHWIASRRQDALRDGTDLWHRKHEYFPSLQFCESVHDHIQKTFPTNPLFRQIKKRLFELQNYCKNWRKGAFEPGQLPCKVTPESAATLQRYRHEHTFHCPDGTDRIFSWHVRLTPGAWRIYFLPEEASKMLIIGYIGPHLPVVSEN